MNTNTDTITPAQAFDFCDGKGLVPAHRHVNGGGWVANTAYVSDSAYVGPNAQVYGNARVRGEAWVHGSAKIKQSSDYLVIGPIGSREAFMTWTRSDNCVATGCFRGTVDEFLSTVAATHGDNRHALAYRAAVALLRALGN